MRNKSAMRNATSEKRGRKATGITKYRTNICLTKDLKTRSMRAAAAADLSLSKYIAAAIESQLKRIKA